MLKLQEQAWTAGKPASVRLAHQATRESFDLLTSKFEKRGLVYKGGPGVYLAEVFYN